MIRPRTFHHYRLIVLYILIRYLPTHYRTLQIKCLVNVLVWWEYITHDDKVNLFAAWKFDSVQAQVSTQQSVWITFYMLWRIL